MPKRIAKTLTILAVKAAQGNGVTRHEIPDAALPGLYLVVQPAGAKSWALRYRQNGKPAKLTLGPVIIEREKPLDEDPSIGSAMTLPEARAVARRELQALTEGQNLTRRKTEAAVQAAARVDDKEFLVEAMAAKFVHGTVKPKNRSWEETRRQFRTEIGFLNREGIDEDLEAYLISRNRKGAKKPPEAWLGRDVRDITKSDVVKLLDGLVDRGSGVTANRVFVTLNTWFNWMVGRDVLRANPMTGLKKFTVESSRDRVLSDDEIRVFWEATKQHTYPFGPMWRLLLLTAQRRQEVSGLPWAELNLKSNDQHWLLPRERSKNGRENYIPICGQTLREIQSIERVRGRDFVFTTTTTTPVSGFSRSKARLDATMVAIMKKEAVERGDDPKRVKLQQWGLHDLRRTAASGMARLGTPIHVTEAILNHSGGTISGVAAVYIRHDFRDEKRAALEAWENFVLVLTGERESNVVSMAGHGGKNRV
ncbi:tyrosine-type recombinase/integrase [Agrobacterium tumefaciens]|uniref:tyrosine-type recombinase/integrase n=1 Tax=Agrobacterium tumefaciens TaxID=358 RepID=UPI00080FF4DD|nr:site-specific integrase [Agrobacterium tumefaciens]NSL22826.1 site-specific integrase [Agrobacterium tumefaciens]NTC56787.1 site-specific integrase [Agrobacterium tumefaciens]NTC62559.1 site-specific integrase [Agrobacterium tumefaciens]NTC66289.1 site-specific integrase [Agrobacterium tumefaciens]NTC74869.1 site-specific integrase [Agrobacterium tumefaciens]